LVVNAPSRSRGPATDGLGHFWQADLGHFSRAPKIGPFIVSSPEMVHLWAEVFTPSLMTLRLRRAALAAGAPAPFVPTPAPHTGGKLGGLGGPRMGKFG
jgi:hypothetical protein